MTNTTRSSMKYADIPLEEFYKEYNMKQPHRIQDALSLHNAQRTYGTTDVEDFISVNPRDIPMQYIEYLKQLIKSLYYLDEMPSLSDLHGSTDINEIIMTIPLDVDNEIIFDFDVDDDITIPDTKLSSNLFNDKLYQIVEYNTDLNDNGLSIIVDSLNHIRVIDGSIKEGVVDVLDFSENNESLYVESYKPVSTNSIDDKSIDSKLYINSEEVIDLHKNLYNLTPRLTLIKENHTNHISKVGVYITEPTPTRKYIPPFNRDDYLKDYILKSITRRLNLVNKEEEESFVIPEVDRHHELANGFITKLKKGNEYMANMNNDIDSHYILTEENIETFLAENYINRNDKLEVVVQ